MNCRTENVPLSRNRLMWQDDEIWLQVEYSVRQICSSLGKQNGIIRAVAEDIAAGYAAIDSNLERLCGQTCACCRDVCCMKATVWYDLRDLLFLYLFSGSLPATQIHRNSDHSCSHLSLAGCLLARHDRPFICTWYICSMQKSLLETQVERSCGIFISQKISEIQRQRKLLEDLCIAAVTCS